MANIERIGLAVIDAGAWDFNLDDSAADIWSIQDGLDWQRPRHAGR